MKQHSTLARVAASRAAGAFIAAALVGGTLACLGTLGCAPGVPQQVPRPELTEKSRAVYARRQLVDARTFYQQERHEAALRAIDRGLRFAPDDPRLHRLQADIFDAMDRPDEASESRARAQALSPVVPPLPDEPIAETSAPPLVVILLPPPTEADPARPWADDRVPERWPAGEARRSLEQRIRTRLPSAEILVLDQATLESRVTSVTSVLEWLSANQDQIALSLRLDRAFCGESTKDGAYSVAWLRVAVARGKPRPLAPERFKTVLEDPPSCRAEAVARAFEQALESPQIRSLLTSDRPPATAEWSHSEVRALFPRLDVLIDRAVAAGREQLAQGELAIAVEHLQRAHELDPLDESTNSLLRDTETALAISRELSQRAPTARDANGWRRAEDPARLRTEFSADERKLAEQRLIEEQLRRDRLMAAVAVRDDADLAATGPILEALQPTDIPDPQAFGPRLARTLSSETIESRTLYGPSGEVIARFYFARESQQLLLREADDDGDGQPDRWVAYIDAVRSQVWQDDEREGERRLHTIYAQDGGRIESVSIDVGRDGTAEQVFRYRDGQVERASHDTTGDGQHDRLEHFDARGKLLLVEQDLDGDGRIDIRTHYRDGRLLSREILSPEAFEAAESRRVI